MIQVSLNKIETSDNKFVNVAGYGDEMKSQHEFFFNTFYDNFVHLAAFICLSSKIVSKNF